MEKLVTLTLTATEATTLRAALGVYKNDRLNQADLAMGKFDTKTATFFDNQAERARLLYEKVLYQHEDQCAA